MGLGEAALLFTMNQLNSIDASNLAQVKNKYRELAGRFNEQVDRIAELEADIDQRIVVSRRYSDARLDVSKRFIATKEELKDLKSEHAVTKETLAQKERYIEKLVAWGEEHIDILKDRGKQIHTLTNKVASRDEKIEHLTNRLNGKEEDLTVRLLANEVIRLGMASIPVEQRIKAISEAVVRNPIHSSPTCVCTEKQGEVQRLIELAMFPDFGAENSAVRVGYADAKNEVKDEMARETAIFEGLVEIKKRLMQEALDNGESLDSVPDIWTIQASMKEAALEKEAALKDIQSEEKEESFGPGM